MVKSARALGQQLLLSTFPPAVFSVSRTKGSFLFFYFYVFSGENINMQGNGRKGETRGWRARFRIKENHVHEHTAFPLENNTRKNKLAKVVGTLPPLIKPLSS